MNDQRYNQLENLYLKMGRQLRPEKNLDTVIADFAKYIVDRDDYVPSSLTNDTNDYDYLKDTMRFWILTQMYMETNGNFEYKEDLYSAKDAVVRWINSVFNKGYDRYLMAQILLGYDCVRYWDLKKEFKFLFKKISDFDKMKRWITRFIELAEKKDTITLVLFMLKMR